MQFLRRGAEKQAQELSTSCGKRYKLPAYTYNAQFSLGQRRAGPGPRTATSGNTTGTRTRPRPRLTEVGVLVGNYPAADDPIAQEALHTLKYAKPKCLEVKYDKPTHQTLTG